MSGVRILPHPSSKRPPRFHVGPLQTATRVIIQKLFIRYVSVLLKTIHWLPSALKINGFAMMDKALLCNGGHSTAATLAFPLFLKHPTSSHSGASVLASSALFSFMHLLPSHLGLSSNTPSPDTCSVCLFIYSDHLAPPGITPIFGASRVLYRSPTPEREGLRRAPWTGVLWAAAAASWRSDVDEPRERGAAKPRSPSSLLRGVKQLQVGRCQGKRALAQARAFQLADL